MFSCFRYCKIQPLYIYIYIYIYIYEKPKQEQIFILLSLFKEKGNRKLAHKPKDRHGKKKKKKGNLEGLLVVGARRGLERPISAITESPGSSYG
jgi:hypothetical protein